MLALVGLAVPLWAGLAAWPGGGSRCTPPTCGRFFSPRSFWNAPLAANTALDPNSRAISAALAHRVETGYRSGAPPNINTTAYSPPIYVVSRRQRRVTVQLDRPQDSAPQLTAAFHSVPLPARARPAQGNDRELIVWQPARDTLWEFWELRRESGSWRATWGGRLTHVQKGRGEYPDPRLSWGTAASGLPLAGGLILPRELRQGRIEHVLTLGIPGVRANYFALPAQRTDGSASCNNAPPEGARFRLDPALDVNSLNLPRPAAVIARAAQRYGIVIRDQAGAVVFYAQNASTFARDPYPALFGGKTPAQLLASFPWSRLQLTRMRLDRMENQPKGLPSLGGLLGCG